MELTSLHAAVVKRAARLRKRSFREADGRFLAEGPQAVREALASPGTAVEVFATLEAAGRHQDLVAAARDGGVPWHQASGAVVGHLADTVTPQGVVAVCRTPHHAFSDVLGRHPRLLAVLAHVRDPGNAGTVIRVADAAGADAVIVTTGSVDPYNPKCVRASVGSLFHLPIITGVQAAAAIGALSDAGLAVIAADGAIGEPLDALAGGGVLAQPTAWVFGNEAWGLPADIAALADRAAAVPIYGRAESLNLSTAAAVCLYASAGAQRQPH